ncbi:hypothetical protein EF888_17445 [Silicimonas algicola]|uniref:Uncharacterized protein n=1 Tax=Silicimonas algicola TaxID=1826607 RepID=A0A316G5N7_9RHOB|nr:hypothetical protein [Silicimonas algicola]AZQ68754.1 hypothetical protein EF888_17445 [Silicimonas algicola]PWK56168.1 hypothetical protein C8D95_105235 [Silicimonas algicola]
MKLLTAIGLGVLASFSSACAQQADPVRKVPPPGYDAPVFTDARGCTFVLRRIAGWELWVQAEPTDTDCRKAIPDDRDAKTL